MRKCALISQVEKWHLVTHDSSASGMSESQCPSLKQLLKAMKRAK